MTSLPVLLPVRLSTRNVDGRHRRHAGIVQPPQCLKYARSPVCTFYARIYNPAWTGELYPMYMDCMDCTLDLFQLSGFYFSCSMDLLTCVFGMCGLLRVVIYFNWRPTWGRLASFGRPRCLILVRCSLLTVAASAAVRQVRLILTLLTVVPY